MATDIKTGLSTDAQTCISTGKQITTVVHSGH